MSRCPARSSAPGTGELRTLLRVALPRMRPGVVTVLLLPVVTTCNNCLLPLTMRNLVIIVPLIVAFLTLQRSWQGGLAAASLK